jgi:hypothetical protein
VKFPELFHGTTSLAYYLSFLRSDFVMPVCPILEVEGKRVEKKPVLNP